MDQTTMCHRDNLTAFRVGNKARYLPKKRRERRDGLPQEVRSPPAEAQGRGEVTRGHPVPAAKFHTCGVAREDSPPVLREAPGTAPAIGTGTAPLPALKANLRPLSPPGPPCLPLPSS